MELHYRSNSKTIKTIIDYLISLQGLSGLIEGQIVEYEEVPNKGKTSAENLKVQR
jgi:hypothetical protein